MIGNMWILIILSFSFGVTAYAATSEPSAVSTAPVGACGAVVVAGLAGVSGREPGDGVAGRAMGGRAVAEADLVFDLASRIEGRLAAGAVTIAFLFVPGVRDTERDGSLREVSRPQALEGPTTE